MANGTKGMGQAPPSGLPPPGGRSRPSTPSANFYGLVLGIASGATRGDAELEMDLERFGLPMGDALVLDASVTHCDDESVLFRGWGQEALIFYRDTIGLALFGQGNKYTIVCFKPL